MTWRLTALRVGYVSVWPLSLLVHGKLCLSASIPAPLHSILCTESQWAGLLIQSRTYGFPACNPPWTSHVTLYLCQVRIVTSRHGWHLASSPAAPSTTSLPCSLRSSYASLLSVIQTHQACFHLGTCVLFGVCKVCHCSPCLSSRSLLSVTLSEKPTVNVLSAIQILDPLNLLSLTV